MLKKIIYQAAVLLLILPSIAMANIHHGANDVFELLVYKSPVDVQKVDNPSRKPRVSTTYKGLS
ncbi:exported hypothetical protein [Alteromonas infernus]